MGSPDTLTSTTYYKKGIPFRICLRGWNYPFQLQDRGESAPLKNGEPRCDLSHSVSDSDRKRLQPGIKPPSFLLRWRPEGADPSYTSSPAVGPWRCCTGARPRQQFQRRWWCCWQQDRRHCCRTHKHHCQLSFPQQWRRHRHHSWRPHQHYRYSLHDYDLPNVMALVTESTSAHPGPHSKPLS